MGVPDLERLFAEAELSIRLQKWQSAASATDQLVAAAPHLSRAWACRGIVQLHLGPIPAAVDAFRKAIALSPEDADSWHHLSMAVHHLGRLGEAEAAARQALLLDTARPPYWLQLGNVFFSQERFTDAAEAYKNAVNLDPQNPTAWNSLGSAHHVQKQWAGALLAYESSVALAPAQLETRLKMADVFERMKAYPAAERIAEQLVVDYPASADSWSLLGRVQLALSKQIAAIASLRRAVDLDPAAHRHSHALQALQYAEDTSPELLLAEHQNWNRIHATPLLPQTPPAPISSPLRIGFLSPHFG